MLGDEGPPPLLPHEEIARGELVERLADRALADPELAREAGLAGERIARPPVAVDEAPDHQIANLGIERAETRHVRRGGGRRVLFVRRSCRDVVSHRRHARPAGDQSYIRYRISVDKALFDFLPSPPGRIFLVRGNPDMTTTHFIVHDKHDNVGVVVVEDVQPGMEVTGWVMET